ncbi:MFS transporter [Nocardia aurantia]|uniref:Multidrug resistance protein Stp n=1 Tax=Nocardia aurantia TaxID=2585199 RepID=A0A7K0E2E2_9NOCA|nr:MFS transporter [Nocardia aurantia]MQY31947.1 Multidrug resistance protein Stp [Nocardia aurantia]
MRNPYAVLALAGASMFMAVVDFTIVNVSLPRMAIDLRLGEDALQWVIIGYGIPFGGFLLLAGRLGDILGRRLALQAGLLLFVAASLTAGLSSTGGQLIGARIAQGVGAALITPSALGIVADAFNEGKQRENALGIYGALAGTAASVGVLAGGLLTDGPGWSWIFYVNIPIGLVLSAATMFVLPENRIAHPGGGFNPVSAFSVTGGLLAGLYALNQGVEQGWAQGSTLGFGAVAMVLLVVFGSAEWRARNPLVPRALLKNMPVVQANLVAASGFGSFLAFVFLTSVVLQQLLGYSPTKTGVAWLLTTLTAFVFAGVTGAVLANKVGTRILLGLASLLVVAASAWLIYLPADASFASRVMPALIAAGMAVGFFAPSVQIGALAGVEETHFGAASGLVETSRELGGALVIASASTVLAGSHSGFLHGVHGGYAVIAAAAALGVLATAFRAKRSTRPEVSVQTAIVEAAA